MGLHYGTVNFHMMTCLVELEKMTRSGRSLVSMMWLGQ